MKDFKIRAWSKRFNRYLSWEEIVKEDLFLPVFTTDEFVREVYTGLNDKNGVEIYEGDILGDRPDGRYKSGYSLHRVVEWGHAGFSPLHETHDQGEPQINPTKMAIIGNIYEQPGLLDKLTP